MYPIFLIGFLALGSGGGLLSRGFEENLGQGTIDAQFLKQTRSGLKVRFAADGSLGFLAPNGGAETWEWIDANANATWQGEGKETSRASYRIGRDASRWITNARCFAKIERRNHYPGIDLLVYENGSGEIEYDLKVHPGADLSRVRLRIRGGKLQGDGGVATTELQQQAPVSYQLNESGLRIVVPSRFVSLGAGVFGIRAEGYAANRELTVDPVIRARRVYGEAGGDDRVIAMSPNVTVGVTRSRSWLRPTSAGDADIFVETTDDSGAKSLVYWGGSGDDVAYGAVIQSLSVTVVGSTNSTDFPVSGKGVQQTFGGGATDGFVVVNITSMNPYSTYIGGDSEERLTAVSSGSGLTAFVGNVKSQHIVTAIANGTIPHVVGSSTGGEDVLVGGLNTSSGSVWLTVMGGSGQDTAAAIEYLGGEMYVAAGKTASADFPTVAPLQEKLKGPSDAWIAVFRIRPGEAPSVVQSTYWGGSGNDWINDIANEAQPGGLFLLGGATDSTDFPLVQGSAKPPGGGLDGFVTQFEMKGNVLMARQSSVFGGSGDDEVLAITPSSTSYTPGYSDPMVAGVTNSPDLQMGGNAFQSAPGGGNDGFVGQLDLRGNLVWASLIGGTGDDRVTAISMVPRPGTQSAGDVRVLIGGTSNSTTWISEFAPDSAEAQVGGDGRARGFTFEYEFAYTAPPAEIIAGRHLQSTLSINPSIPHQESPVLRIRSADPAKLLLSIDGGQTGHGEVFLVAGEMRPDITLLALDSSGVVDVFISGSAIPSRKVVVRLARSAVILNRNLQTVVPPLRSIYAQAEFAAIDPATGKLLPVQTLRPGVQAMLRLTTSNESGLRPSFVPEPGNGYYNLPMDAVAEGTYQITVGSPLFDTVAESSAQIVVTKEPFVGTPTIPKFFLAKDGITVLTSNFFATLEVTSSNPERVKVLDKNFIPQASATSITPGYAVCVSDEGSARVKAVNTTDGSRYTEVEIFCTPGYAVLPVADVTMTVGGRAAIYLQLLPDVEPVPGITSVDSFLPNLDFESLALLDGTVRLVSAIADPYSRRTSFTVEGVRPGQITLTVQAPSGVRTKGPLTVQIKVLEETIRLAQDRNEFRIGERTTQDVYPEVQLRNPDLQALVEIADPNILQFVGGVSPTRVTINSFRFGSGFTVQAKGKAGAVTTITVTIAGQKFVTPVRIMPTVLVPVASELSIFGKSTIRLIPAFVEPETGRLVRVASRFDYFDNSISSLPVRVNTTGDGCIFGETLESPYPGNVSVAVACYGPGPVLARFSVPGGPFSEPPANGTLRIRVAEDSQRVPQIQRILVGKGLQAVQSNLCCTPQPPYKLTSMDPSRLLLSTTPGGPGRATVENVDLSGRVYLRALASEGVVQVRLDGSNGIAQWWVHLYPSTIAFQRSAFDTAVATGATTLTALSISPYVATPEGEPLPVRLGFAPGTEPFLVKVTSDRPETAEPVSPTPLISDQTSDATVTLRIKAQGTAQITLAQPEGFLSNRGATVRVNRPRIALANEVILSKDLAMSVGFNLLPYTTSLVPLTVTSLDPDKLLVAGTAQESGRISVVTQNGEYRVYLQGLVSQGQARVRVSAVGLEDLVFPVDMVPAATVVSRYESGFPGGGGTVGLQVGPQRGNRLLDGSSWTPVPGKAFTARLRSSDPQIVRVVGSGVVSTSDRSGYLVFTLQQLRPGSAELTLEADPRAPLLDPASGQWKVTVGPWQVQFNVPSLIARGIATPLNVFDSGDPLRPPAILSAVPAGAVLFSLSSSGPWSTTLDVPPGRVQPYIAGASAGPTDVTVSIEGTDIAPQKVNTTVREPQFLLNYPDGNLGIPLTQGRATVRLQLSSPNYYNGVLEGSLAPGLGSASVTVRSSDPTVVSVTTPALEFTAGVSRRDVTLQLLKKGTAILSVAVPPGFEVSPSWGRILVTVQ